MGVAGAAHARVVPPLRLSDLKCAPAMHVPIPQSMKTEFDFFNTTLAWHNQYNLMDALNKAGISPGGSVSVDSLVQAVEATYGGGATVQCSSGTLESIEMCLDKNFNTMSCPSGAMQGTCTSSSVNFPSSN